MARCFDSDRWFTTLEGRYRGDLTFPEVRRGLQALSSLYVERRDRIGRGKALDGRGKRAAFALYFGPLHFVTLRGIARALGDDIPRLRTIVDLGCGTGTSGAAWALASRVPSITGVDTSAWAADEASWTYRELGLRGSAHRGDLLKAPIGAPGEGVLAAFSVNELDEAGRKTLLARLLLAHRAGSCILIVEPIAKRALPWWPAWSEAFHKAGGRADEWRFAAELPEGVRLLDRAAGLDHRELTARSMLLG